MFATIQEGLEAYKAELRRYKEWNEREASLMEQHKASQTSAHEAYWVHRLEGMKLVLGLTPDEISQIHAEVGFIKKEATTT